MGRGPCPAWRSSRRCGSRVRLGSVTKVFAPYTLAELREIWAAGNVYLADRQPWKLIQMDRPSAETIVRTSINLVRLLAVLSDPLIPETARKVFDALAASSDERRWPVDVAVKTRRPGRRVQHIDLLFRRITDAETAEWTARFAGAEPPPVAFHADRE